MMSELFTTETRLEPQHAPLMAIVDRFARLCGSKGLHHNRATFDIFALPKWSLLSSKASVVRLVPCGYEKETLPMQCIGRLVLRVRSRCRDPIMARLPYRWVSSSSSFLQAVSILWDGCKFSLCAQFAWVFWIGCGWSAIVPCFQC